MANIYAVYCAVKLVLLRKGRVRMNWQKERFSQKQLTSESFDNDNKLTLKSFFAFCSVFHMNKRRKDGNDF